MQLTQKAKGIVKDVKTYWKVPRFGRYMTFKEIAAYAGGGIGAYFIITLGTNLMVGTANMIVGGAIGVAPTDMWILYLISTLANIPLTAIRANIIDNTRGKSGKYRPYLLSMGIPTALVAIAYVWFPYEQMYSLFPTLMFGKEMGYVIKCAMVLLFCLLLQFFFNFFNDAYTNLIHVLSPNTQERTDVLAIKSVVYSLAPSIVNIVLPIIAQVVADDNLYDIRVYRYTYPVFAVIGIALTIVVYANTQEKIVQAKTHTIQISFMDSLREVARNKYFWIIALAGWLGFLESSYGVILQWSYTYGHTCSGSAMALINTLTGNASLWGMLLAPICIRKWGKKKVLIGVNMLNVLFILAMIVDMRNIWWLFVCVYLNWLVGAFEQITTPAIQADIRDYQQYQSGERIDGMFSAVTTIGSVVTLFTSSIIPLVQKYYGVHDQNGYAKPLDILDANNDGGELLYKLMAAMIIMAAVGAFMNVVPYFFYDLDERRQKAIVRILKIRALFEDYSNGVLDDANVVEAIDIIRFAQKQQNEEPVVADKKYKKNIAKPDIALKKPDKALKKTDKAAYSMAEKDYKVAVKAAKKEYKASVKAAKKEYKEALNFNEEIEISKLVCQELNKFETPFYKKQVEANKAVLAKGLSGLLEQDITSAKEELKAAKQMPKGTDEEKEYRKFAIEIAQKKVVSCKAIKEYYSHGEELKAPDFTTLDRLFSEEDACDEKLRELTLKLSDAKKEKNAEEKERLKAEIKKVTAERKNILKAEKVEMDMHARLGRAEKPYLYAEKLVKQQEIHNHLDDILALYDDAKQRYEAKLAADKAEADRIRAEEKALEAKILAEKKAKKAAKKK